MSATILPFCRILTVNFAIGPAERAQAAAWAARLTGLRGGHWRVETHRGDDGVAWLGIVTPSSCGLKEEDLSLSWLLSGTADGIVLTRMPSGRVSGTFPALGRALAAVELAEAQPCRPAADRPSVRGPGAKHLALAAPPAPAAMRPSRPRPEEGRPRAL